MALVGPSGCGKTTALRLVNRLLEADAGSVRVFGRDVREEDPVGLRRRIGYVIQEGGLFPHWSVANNIEVVPRLLGWTPQRRRARSEELLAMVNLPYGEFAARSPRELSGGQRQRVGVARALAGDPSLVLMDEPFGALDPIARRALQREFSGWKTFPPIQVSIHCNEAQAPTAEMAATPPSIRKSAPTTYAESSDAR